MKDLPEHLKELIQPTPSGVDKLLAAWDGLSVETQLLILSIINTKDYLLSAADDSAPDKIRIKALDSVNDFVRYTAAKEMFFPRGCTDEEKAIEQKIKNDPSDLVKYALDRDTLGILTDSRLDDAKEFFSLPHKQRLALVRNLTGYGSGEVVSNLIKYAIKNNISEEEVSEILQDFLIHPKPPKHGLLLKLAYGGDLRSISELVALIPVSHKARNPFIVSLSKLEIENFDYLDNLTEEELAFLLSQKTFVVEDYRKKVFWSGNFLDEGKKEKRLAERLLNNSVIYNFSITDSELSEIFLKPRGERFYFLKCLSQAQELELYQDLAIYYHVLHRLNTSALYEKIKEKLEKLEDNDYGYKRSIKAFRFVEMAWIAKRWTCAEDSKIYGIESRFRQNLYDNIVPDNVWETYISWKSNRVSCGKLPYVYDFEADVDVDDEYLDDSEDEDKLDVVEITESIEKIKDKLWDIDLNTSKNRSNIESLKIDQSIDMHKIESIIIMLGVGVLALVVVFFLTWV